VVLLQAGLLLGALLLVGVAPDAPWVLLGVLAASAVCFVALMQLLKAAFGLVGEFVGVVLLVLQVAAGEGAYPIQTFGTFFQAVHPYLPMSWTNDAVRRSVAGGPLTPYVWVDVGLLLGTAAVAFALTCLAARRRERWTPARLRPSVELV
ncbi:YhgE/Pip family protein, partial [Cellulomonas septica]